MKKQLQGKMVCPKVKDCAIKPIWNRPEWDFVRDVQVGETPCLQGQCKPHKHNENCGAGTNCPACVPYKKGE